MACPCGSNILKQRVATHSTPENVYELSFRECDSCQRIGFERLTCANELVSQDVEARARFQQLGQNPAQQWASQVTDSSYRPYKIWITPCRQEVRVCLIRLATQTVALCPEYRLMSKGDDYLVTLFELSRELIKAMGFPAETRLSSTDSAPFELSWGSKPTIVSENMRTVQPTLTGQSEKEEIPTHEQTLTETVEPEPKVEAKKRLETPNSASLIVEDQLDLFG